MVKTPRLSESELEQAWKLIEEVKDKLQALAQGDPRRLFAFRRKVYKELVYEERSTPMKRRALRARLHTAQGGVCFVCKKTHEAGFMVLDRVDPVLGYVDTNVELVCSDCDRQRQTERGFR